MLKTTMGVTMPSRNVWKSADGTETPVELMEDGHIYNVLTLLKRSQLKALLKGEKEQSRKQRAAFNTHWIKTLEAERNKRQAEFVENAKKKSLNEIFNL